MSALQLVRCVGQGLAAFALLFIGSAGLLALVPMWDAANPVVVGLLLLCGALAAAGLLLTENLARWVHDARIMRKYEAPMTDLKRPTRRKPR
jgi:hypothetical protein